MIVIGSCVLFGIVSCLWSYSLGRFLQAKECKVFLDGVHKRQRIELDALKVSIFRHNIRQEYRQ